MYEQFWIYRITNLVTNKFYIGQTKNLYNRLKSHKACKDKNTIIVKSIMKYGWENHAHDILFFSESITKKEADEIEEYYIKKYNSYCKFNKMGMNLTDGGYKGSINKKSYKKISDNKNKKWSDNICKTGINVILLNLNGDILTKSKAENISDVFSFIKEKNVSSKSSIKRALTWKMWTCYKKEYIIGFEDEDVYTKYLQDKKRRSDFAKNKPTSGNSTKSLMEYHKKVHDLPVLDLNTGVYFDTISEFSKQEGIHLSSVQERFQKGYYKGKYIICRN